MPVAAAPLVRLEPTRPAYDGAGFRFARFQWCAAQADVNNGAGNDLVGARVIAVEAAGNAYVAGRFCDNAFKITPEPDCNNNGIPDERDLADATLHDDDGSGVADECKAASDLDGDGSIDIIDLLLPAHQLGSVPAQWRLPRRPQRRRDR